MQALLTFTADHYGRTST